MAVIGGWVFVLVSVMVGFMMAGGHIHALVHPSEFVTIGGAAFGSMLVCSPKKVLMDVFKSVIGVLKGSPYNKATFGELFKLLYAMGRLVRQEGLLGLDSHVSNPAASTLLKQYPKINNNHHARDFLCSALGLIVDGNTDSAQLAGWLEEEIVVRDREHHAAIAALSKVADALPGFGIVAAVLGIVVTMQAIGGPVEEIGHKVGAALVGTFLGILMSYGFIAPLAGRLEAEGEMEMGFYRAISTAVIALAEGASPKDVVIRARRVVATDVRPSQTELTNMLRAAGG